MATPVVSGAAAAFMEAWPGATPAEVHERIVASAARGVLRWGGSDEAASASASAASAAAAAAEASTANLLLQSPPPPRPALSVWPPSLPPVILFEGGEREEGENGKASREKLVVSLPPLSSNFDDDEEQNIETPFEVRVDFFAGGAPAGWLSASPSSGILTRANLTATVELSFDASGFSTSSSLSADVVISSLGELAARRRASARVFCSRLAMAPRGGARRVTRMDFLESWDEATGPPGKKKWSSSFPATSSPSSSSSSQSFSSSSSSPWVSATLAVALSHPVASNSLPEGSFVVNGGEGEVVSVAAARGEGGGGGSCSEWVVRVRAPASSSSKSSSSSPPSTSLCVSLSPRGVFDVWGAPFGAREGNQQSGNCTEIRLAPRLRLFAPFAAAAAPEVVISPPSQNPLAPSLLLLSAQAEVAASEQGRVLLLLSASEPVQGLDVSSFDVAIERRRERERDGGGGRREEGDDDGEERARVVSLSPVEKEDLKDKAAATLWHAVLQLPAGYLGPVVVSLRTQAIGSAAAEGIDAAAAVAAAAPSAPLALRIVAAPLLRPTGFQLLF